MSNTNYAGLDYSGPGSTANRDPETGIRYGVIAQNSLSSWALDDIFYNSRDLSYEAAKEELINSLVSTYDAEWDESDEAQESALEGDLVELYYGESRATDRAVMAKELASAFRESRGWTTDMRDDLVWSIVSDRFGDTYQCDEPDWLYEKDGYVLSKCLDYDVFVSKSPYCTYAAYCSPCVPGAGNLDAALSYEQWVGPTITDTELAAFPKVFCLGADWFEDGEAPYPVFSVETGKLMMKEEK